MLLHVAEQVESFQLVFVHLEANFAQAHAHLALLLPYIDHKSLALDSLELEIFFRTLDKNSSSHPCKYIHNTECILLSP